MLERKRMSLPARLLPSTLMSTLGRVAGTAISVFTIAVVTRGLAETVGVSGYGAYATVFAFLGFVAILADGGLYLVFTRAAARLSTAAEDLLLRRLLRLRIFLLLLGGALAGAVAWAYGFPPYVVGGILLGTFGTASQLMSQLTLGVFQKRLRLGPPNVWEVIGRAVTLLLAILIARRGAGVLPYVGAFVVGAATTAGGNILAARRVLRVERAVAEEAPPAPPPKIRGILREAIPLGLLLLAWQVVFRADSVLLSFLRPPEDLGWYALPYKVLESLLFFPAMVGGLLLPRFSAAAPLPHRAEFRALLRSSERLFLLLAVPIVGLLVVTSPLVIRLLGGESFAPSVAILRVLALAFGFLCFGNLYGNTAIALGAERALLRAAAVLAAANVSVNLLLIPRFAGLGAAWTTLGTECLSAVWAAAIVRRKLRQ